MNDLPEGWVMVALADLGAAGEQAVLTGPFGSNMGREDFTPSGIPVFTIGCLGVDGIVRSKLLHVSPATAKQLKTYRLKKGDFLFSRMASVGRAGIVPPDLSGALFNYHLMRLRLNESAIFPRLFFYYVRGSQVVREYLEAVSRGATRDGINTKLLLNMPVTVPPVPEQQRIVAKIDSLSGKSKRARDHLDHMPRLVEKYKQAILAAAFRGELIGLAPVPTELPNPKCWNLPTGWRWALFSEAAEISSNLVKPNLIPELPHIAPDNVESGTGRLLPYRTIEEDKVISAKHRFRSGQVIYSKIRPYLRKAVIVDFEGACSADMYPLTPKESVSAKFLLYWLISEQFGAFTIEHEGRTVLPKINQIGLNSTPFPLAPFSAQQEIANRIGVAFSWIDRLASEATSARKLIDHLDQAILAKAFRGELVPQDPNDEPASVLLERIKASRQATPAGGRGRARASG